MILSPDRKSRPSRFFRARLEPESELAMDQEPNLLLRTF
jgi:hypothetical protein